MLASLIQGLAGAILGALGKLWLLWTAYRAGKASQHSADVEAEKDTLERERDALARGQESPDKSLNDGSF